MALLEPLKGDRVSYMQGLCHFETQAYPQAKDKFSECLALPDAYIMLALCEQKLGNQQSASELIDNCIERHSDYTEAYLMKAYHCKQQGNFKLAVAVYLTCKHESSRVYAGLAECYTALKRYDKALESITKAIECGKNDTKLICNKGEVLFYLKRYDQALSCL